jgi:aminoglycoside phosphotransferase (APT) family kinase protein
MAENALSRQKTFLRTNGMVFHRSHLYGLSRRHRQLLPRSDREEWGKTLADFDAEHLSAWLQSRVTGFGRLISIEKFSGGQSNPSYRLRDQSASYVLRRKPFGQLLPSAHAIEREYRAITALHPTGFPVPATYALCEDAGVIGAPFYVMEMVEGRTFWDGSLPDQSREERHAIYVSLVETMARLHQQDPAAIGLSDYGPPGNYFERQVGRWTKQYRAAQTDDLEMVEKLIAWLPATLPPQERVSIIHGDYRIDNVVFGADRPAATAVLDWELSTLGDPLADFAYLAMNWAMPAGDRKAGLLGLDLAALNIPRLPEVTELYCRLTDREGVPDLNWYFAYNLFRLVGIVQGIKKRALDGNASSADALEAGGRVPELAARAWEFARLAGAPQ